MNQNINPIDQTVKSPRLVRESYGFASTRDILNKFAQHGWQVTETQFGSPIKKDNQGFQKHLIRLDNPSLPSIPGLTTDNESRAQLCLVNSHDGTGALRLVWGIFRIACLNGIISGSTLKEFKAVHSKSILTKLDQGIDFMLDGMPEVIGAVQKLQTATFQNDATTQLVKTLVDARLANVKNIVSIDYASALVARRAQDTAQDAFTITNRVQESVIRGGVHYSYLREIRDDQGKIIEKRLTHATTRALKSVPSQIKLNRLVFDKALELAS